jgi:pyruvate/2-oxoacid:ferredoxin oxidoreductase alpha subunit/pyruvate/2-oxoacid:ferredoxin oxidoreductase beta subunit
MKMYLSGSEALAQAVKLSRVDVMSAYPITPNTPSLLAMYDLIKSGEMDTDSVNAESELGSMLICAGAASVGLRTFNCTAAQGLALMREPLWMASGMALPVVLAITSRQVGSPQGLLSDFSDCFSERDASVVQYICENHQEVVDSMIMSYRVAENSKVLLPAFVVLEGFRITHSYEMVDIPEQEQVDRFLPKYNPKHAFVDTSYPITQGAGAFTHYYGLKYQQYRAMLDARGVILDAIKDFGDIFGRKYPGLIETYKTEDADVVFVAMGTVVSMLRDVIDDFRSKGVKVGLLKIRVFRPFPEDEIVEALSGIDHVVVIDRAVTPGRREGITYIEIASCLAKGNPVKLSNYILSGCDVETRDVAKIVDDALQAKEPFLKWHPGLFEESASNLTGYQNYVALAEKDEKNIPLLQEGQQLMAEGSTTCPGCVSLSSVKQCLEEFDQDTVVTNNAGCLMAASAIFPVTAFRVPHIFYTYSNAGAAASGIEVALKRQGKDTKVFLFGGDGGMFDIGLQTFSAALERGHEIIYVCYDNEAYMNTGVQRSGATPMKAKTKTTPMGKKERKKDIMQIVMAHGDVYAATASPAFPLDLKKKIRKAKECKKPAFIHVLSPCPPGWEYTEEKGITVARLSVETNFFPLYEFDDGKIKVKKNKKKKPVKEYLQLQGRFSHLTDEEIDDVQKNVDMAFEKLLRLEEFGKTQGDS